MPPKAAAPTADSGLTAKEVGLLKAMATLMDEAPKVSLSFVFASVSTSWSSDHSSINLFLSLLLLPL
jgi:hypothetical protein